MHYFVDGGRELKFTISPSINEEFVVAVVVAVDDDVKITDAMNIVARKPSTVEERSDAIVNKLEVLDQRLASKVCCQEVLNQHATLF